MRCYYVLYVVMSYKIQFHVILLNIIGTQFFFTRMFATMESLKYVTVDN